QPWLLVTSARHMPRALAVFRAVGWNVAPSPVDYRSVGFSRWTDYSLARGAVRWQLVLHEWMGLAAYSVAARLSLRA
ncbi:MAG: ElyC/SanA/YdcF family protein, partial [Polaromonas sp.]